MARTGYRVAWVAQAQADMGILRRQHQRTFPRNLLAVVKGYVKVSVLEAESVPANSLTTEKVRIEWAKTPDLEMSILTLEKL